MVDSFRTGMDLVQVPANVKTSDGVTPKIGKSGAAILAGDALYKDTNGALQPADANGTGTRGAVGAAVSSAPGVGQPVFWIDIDPDFNPGAVCVAGTPYFLSANPGKISDAEPASGSDTVLIGVGKANGHMSLNVFAPGVAVP